jgi:hypothetical protein
MTTRHDRQEIRAQAQAMRMQAQQMRQRAARARQEAAMTCAQARLAELMGLMPGSTAMTCEIAAIILTQRGLLDGT